MTNYRGIKCQQRTAYRAHYSAYLDATLHEKYDEENEYWR